MIRRDFSGATPVLIGASGMFCYFIMFSPFINSFRKRPVPARSFASVIYMATRNRPDKDGAHRAQFEKNKKRIYATQTVCAICGKPVDFSLKYPHPLSPTIDHIIPLAKGGHPSDIDNLQLAHRCCNRRKSDKLIGVKQVEEHQVISNRVLPSTFDWYSSPPAPVRR